MTPDNLLLSSVSWRGIPKAYEPGALGDTGLRFREAFDTWLSKNNEPADLAFECFAGLLFNGDYSDLVEFRHLVDSWIEMPGDAVIRIVEPLEMWRTRYGYDPETAWRLPKQCISLTYGNVPWRFYWVPPGYFGFVPPDGEWPGWINRLACPRGILVSLRVPVRETTGLLTGFPHLALYSIRGELLGFAETIEWPESRYIGGSFSEFKTDGLGWGFTSRPRHGFTSRGGPFEVWFAPEFDQAGISPVFTASVCELLKVYVNLETSIDREYPRVVDTAHADNGWIFNNWAAGKFGNPVAG